MSRYLIILPNFILGFVFFMYASYLLSVGQEWSSIPWFFLFLLNLAMAIFLWLDKILDNQEEIKNNQKDIMENQKHILETK